MRDVNAAPFIIPLSLHKIDLFTKRLFDFSAALFLLALTFPFFLLIMVFIKLSSRGTVFHNRMRVGKNGELFLMYKFRTMRHDAETMLLQDIQAWQEYQGAFKIRHDRRVTWVGKFLRRSCLDELPQLLNVIKGDMSLVGPRPLLPEEKGKVRPVRFSVLPGLTGLWQISGKNDRAYSEKELLDQSYVANRNLFMDLSIILKTIPAIIRGKGFF